MTWKVLYKISENIQFSYITKQDIRIYMSPITSQTTGRIGLNFLWTLMSSLGVSLAKKVQNLIFLKYF